MKLLQIASFNIIIFIIIAIKIEKINSESSEEKNSEDNERVKRSFLPYRTGKKVASQVSTVLDRLLFFSGYDKRIRPYVRKVFNSEKLGPIFVGSPLLQLKN